MSGRDAFSPADFSAVSELVLEECAKAVRAMDPVQVRLYLDALYGAEKVFFVGVGRVLLSLESIAKRYAHLGIQAVVVGQITEPAITPADLLVVGSGSGETLFPVGIARKAKAVGAKIAHIGSNPSSSLSDITDVFVRIPVAGKKPVPGAIESRQPMTSLFEQSLLLFGDITAKMVIQEKNLDMSGLWRFHANLE